MAIIRRLGGDSRPLKPKTRALIGVVVLGLLFSSLARAEDLPVRPVSGVQLKQGEIAPFAGALFGNEALVALAEALREREMLQDRIRLQDEQIGALKSRGDELSTAYKELEESRKHSELALAKAELQIEIFTQIRSIYESALAEYRNAVEIYKASNERLAREAEAARNDAWWSRLLGTLTPIVALIGVITGF